MAGQGLPESELDRFLAETVAQARRVLDAEGDSAKYDAPAIYDEGLGFMSMATAWISSHPEAKSVESMGWDLFLIWGELTDAMDAPGTGSPEQDEAAVRHMREAAAEWLTVVDSPDARAAYLDRWVHDECGYERKA